MRLALPHMLFRSLTTVLLLVIGFLLGWICAIVLIAGGPLPAPFSALVGQGRIANTATPAKLRDQFAVFWEVWDLVDAQFYQRDKLDQTRMIRGAINGMLSSLEDPYTVYQEPNLAAQTNDHLQGKLGGIGTYLRVSDGHAFLHKPFKNGPAAQAGLQNDDEIMAVDEQLVATIIAGLDPNEASVQLASKLRGPEGSTVVLRIQRASETSQREVSLVRRDIVVPSVEALMLERRVAYIRITEFKGNTTAEFDEALRSLLLQQPAGLILDLRNNPGGLLSGAQETLGRFYTGVALYEIDYQGQETQLETIVGPENVRVGDLPVVVLINAGTASASEIVAGALHDQRPHTILLGEKTFGKGSVQHIFPLQDGGNARVTFAHWFTPKHGLIHGQGISPDQSLPYSDAPGTAVTCIAERQPIPGEQLCNDNQLFAAIQQLGR